MIFSIRGSFLGQKTVNVAIVTVTGVTVTDDDCSGLPLQIPEDLTSGKDRIIFGNVRAIYDLHKK